MKGFLEEYGVIIIVAIVALIMVMLATPLGHYIGEAIVQTVSKFVEESGVDAPSITLPW